MADVVIVDYEAGNLRSVEQAVLSLKLEPEVTGDPERVRKAPRLIFPGVGAAGSAMTRLRSAGLDEALIEYCATGRPLLGICLGTQIIFDHSEEDDTACLGILQGKVAKFPEPLLDSGSCLKVPHMGWNSVDFVRNHFVWQGITPGSEFYFVHSYSPLPAAADIVIGETRYGITFASAVARENLVAFQFHPERSGRVGLSVLGNFLRWTP